MLPSAATTKVGAGKTAQAAALAALPPLVRTIAACAVIHHGIAQPPFPARGGFPPVTKMIFA